MKKSLISKLLVGALLVTSILPLAGSTSVYAADTKEKGKWVIDKGDWYYYDENGVMVKNTTITIGDQKYKFDEYGVYQESEENRKATEEELKKHNEQMKVYHAKYPKTNECSEEYKKKDDRWSNKDGKWYFDWKFPDSEAGEDAVIDDWDEINGYWYHFNKDGVMDRDTTIKDEAGNDCILNSDGVLTNRKEPEFKKEDAINPKYEYKKTVIDGNIYYINDKGEKLTGWYQDDNGKWYFLDSKGAMQKDTTIIDKGQKYVLGSDGAWIQ